jgi:hypothetical protein
MSTITQRLDDFFQIDSANMKGESREIFIPNTSTGVMLYQNQTQAIAKSLRLPAIINGFQLVVENDKVIATRNYRTTLSVKDGIFTRRITVNYKLEYVITNSGQNIIAKGHNGLIYYLIDKNWDKNLQARNKAIDLLGGTPSDEEIKNKIAESLIIFTLDEPQFDLDDLSFDILTKEVENGVELFVSLESLSNSSVPTPLKYYWQIEPTEDIIGIPGSAKSAGDGTFGLDKLLISNDLRNRKALHLMSTGNVKVKCVLHFKEDDGDITGLTCDKEINFSEFLESIDYYKL